MIELHMGLNTRPSVNHLKCPVQNVCVPAVFYGQAKLMSECAESIDSVKRVKHILNDDRPLEGQGLTILSSADQQTGVWVSLPSPLP